MEMQNKPINIIRNRYTKQLSSIYIIVMLIGSAFSGLTIADDPIFGDWITTYKDDFGTMNQNTDFFDGDLVIVNITVDNSTGDPLGETNWIIATNNNTGEWIKVYVTDNDTVGPWGSENIQNDSMYWGIFSVNSSQITVNNTPPTLSNLQVNVGDKIDLFENQFGSFDGDGDIAHTSITIIPMGGPGDDNASICGFIMNSTLHPIENAIILLNRTDGPPFQSTIHTNSSGYYLFDHNTSASGTYDLTAYKPAEYAPVTEFAIHLFPNETLWINLTLGGGGGPVQGNGTLCGFVNYQDTGSPIMNVEIFIQRTVGEFFESRVYTNDSGYYKFDNNVSEGTYHIEVSKSGEFDTVTLDNVQIWENQTHWKNFSITIGGGPPPGEIDNITITGFIYQDFTPQLPISNANISVFTQGDPNDLLNTTNSDWEGFFELTFKPNETAVGQGTDQVEVLFEADGYHSHSKNDNIWWMLNDQGGMVDYDNVWLEKIWEINATVTGTIRDLNTDNPLEDVFVMAEGDRFFRNFTQTDNQGDFSIGVIAGENELLFEMEDYFVNGTDIITITEGVTNIGTIYLEEKPGYNSLIAGNLTSNGQPISDTELILYDPLHPFDGEEKQFPRTDENGYYEIDSYPGTFYLITLAKLIGKSREGPPLAIGGYENVVDQIIIGDNETLYHDITLNSTTPDPITIDIEFNAWNISTVNMSRQITSNNKIIRLMSDINFDGTISEDEAADMEDIVNSSLTEPEGFDMEALFLTIPLQFSVDDVVFSPVETQVEIHNLMGSTTDTDPLNVIVNATYVAIDFINLEVPLGPSLHFVEVKTYLKNPAFSSTITTTFPSPFILKNAKEELATITGYGTNQAIIIPHQDPNWNDSEIHTIVPMLVGTSDPFASFNTSYYVETPFDDDADGDYDYLMGKVKFSTTQEGDYYFEGTLRTQTGIQIGSFELDKYANTGTTPVEVSFRGETIYRKHFNGPYSMIFDLYVYENDTLIWLDSLSKTTAAYNASEFDKPPLHFIQILDDTGQDTDNDGLFDYLIISLELDVGQIDTYDFDADIGIADYSYHGDPHITHMHKTISLHQTGIQIVNFSFDGSLIYEKQTNASLWAYIQAHSFTEGRLDDIDYITETYHYDELQARHQKVV